jgi:hypothetical protein
MLEVRAKRAGGEDLKASAADDFSQEQYGDWGVLVGSQRVSMREYQS